MSTLYNIAIFILVVFTVLTVVLYIFQRNLIYYPDKTYAKPTDVGLSNVEEVNLTTPDNAKLINWYAKAKPGNPTLLYFHGNAGNLANRKDRIALYQSHGLGIMMASYRGYSGGKGNPTEKDIIQDGLQVYDWLVSSGVSPENIILYGESLGTGVAVQVASQRKTKAVILETPYASLAEIGANHYPYLPVHLLMTDRFESITFIKNINAPLLILHGWQDRTIPLQSAKKLFEAANQPKQMETYQNGQHNDLYTHGAWQDILKFLENGLKTY